MSATEKKVPKVYFVAAGNNLQVFVNKQISKLNKENLGKQKFIQQDTPLTWLHCTPS